MKIEQTVILLYVSKIHIPRNPDFEQIWFLDVQILDLFYIKHTKYYFPKV